VQPCATCLAPASLENKKIRETLISSLNIHESTFVLCFAARYVTCATRFRDTRSAHANHRVRKVHFRRIGESLAAGPVFPFSSPFLHPSPSIVSANRATGSRSSGKSRGRRGCRMSTRDAAMRAGAWKTSRRHLSTRLRLAVVIAKGGRGHAMVSAEFENRPATRMCVNGAWPIANLREAERKPVISTTVTDARPNTRKR